MNNKMKLSEPDKLALKLGNVGGGRTVQSDHAQNDPTQPDYIKNRLAYEDRKFEDMEAVEYPEPIVANIEMEDEGEIYREPFMLKFAELPENASPLELIESIVGFALMEEEMRFDDPEMFPPEYMQLIQRQEIVDETGQPIGAYLTIESMPYVIVINEDNYLYNHRTFYEEDGETYWETIPIRFSEKGVYLMIFGSEEDDEGEIVKYYTADKIFFSGVKTIDKKFLPSEVLHPIINVDNEPTRDSYRPISSHAVAQLQYALENNKMDKIPWSSSQEGYVVGVYKGQLQLMTIYTTPLGPAFNILSSQFKAHADTFGTFKQDYEAHESNFEELKTAFEAHKEEFYNYQTGYPLALGARISNIERLLSNSIINISTADNGKIAAVVDGKLALVDIDTLQEGETNV